MTGIAKEFNDREARMRHRRSLSSSDMLSWPLEEWVSWLEDGLEVFCSMKASNVDRNSAFSPFFLQAGRVDVVDEYMLANRLERLQLGEVIKILGQAMIDVCQTEYCLVGRGINLAKKADFLLTLCEQIVPSRSIELIEKILRLHDEGFIDISSDDNLVSNCVYAMRDHAGENKVAEVACRFSDFVKAFNSQWTTEAFDQIPKVG